MHNLLRIAAALTTLLSLQSSADDVADAMKMAAGIDMAVAQKWAAAKVIQFHVEGVHKGRTAVVHGDYEGKADVVDRITVDFTWDAKKRKIIGPFTVTDAKSALSNIKSDGTNCPPPQLKGDYEHFQSVSNSLISGDQIQIKGQRTFPPASVSNYPASCSMRSIPGGKEEVLLYVSGADPQAMAMPNMPGSPITVSADRKSFSVKGSENWVWTYTPTLLQ